MMFNYKELEEKLETVHDLLFLPPSKPTRTSSTFHVIRKLDKTDLDIIFTMQKSLVNGPRSVRKIAKELKLSQQTVDYKVKRLERFNIRFKAIIDEQSLGLTSYLTIVNCSALSDKFLTCYPVWRFLSRISGGRVNGYSVLYSIPSEKETDLEEFLKMLRKKGIIRDVEEFQETTQSFSNIPSQRTFLEMKKTVDEWGTTVFNWNRWVQCIDESEQIDIFEEEDQSGRSFKITYKDLVILSRLKENLRERFCDIAKQLGIYSALVTNRYRELVKCGLIKGCKVELNPIDLNHRLYLFTELEFNDESMLKKFASHLNEVPYPFIYWKAKGKNVLFLHATLPFQEYYDFLRALDFLNQEYDVTSQVYLSGPYSVNDELYKAFSGNKWVFSFDILRQKLEERIEEAIYISKVLKQHQN